MLFEFFPAVPAVPPAGPGKVVCAILRLLRLPSPWEETPLCGAGALAALGGTLTPHLPRADGPLGSQSRTAEAAEVPTGVDPFLPSPAGWWGRFSAP